MKIQKQYPTKCVIDTLWGNELEMDLTYTSVINGHEVELKAWGSYIPEVGGTLEVSFEVDETVEKLDSSKGSRIAITKFLLGVWEHLALWSECYQVSLLCDAVVLNNDYFRAGIYNKLGFNLRPAPLGKSGHWMEYYPPSMLAS